MGKKFLSILLALFLIQSTFGNIPAVNAADTVDVYWNTVGGGGIYWLYGSVVGITTSRSAGVHFNALNSFSHITLGFSKNGTINAKIALYDWKGDYSSSVSSAPVWQIADYTVSDGVNKIQLDTPVSKGEYLLVVSDVTTTDNGYVAIWSQPTKNPDIDYYVQGNAAVVRDIDYEFISGGITYVDNSVNSFGPVSTPYNMYWGQVGGGSAYFLYHDSETKGALRTAAAHFNAKSPFFKIYLGVNEGSLKLKYSLYNWSISYDYTLKSSPVWSMTEETASPAGENTIYLGQNLPEGEYLLLVSVAEGQTMAGAHKAIWTFAENTAVQYFANGVITHSEHECISGGIAYVNDSEKTLGTLTEGTDAVWTAEENTYVLSTYDLVYNNITSFGFQLRTTEKMYRLILSLQANSDTDTCDIHIFRWNRNYSTSVKGVPVFEVKNFNIGKTGVDQKRIIDFGKFIDAGEYLIVVDNIKYSNTSVWAGSCDGTKSGNVVYYRNGQQTDSDYIYGAVSYISTPGTLFEQVSAPIPETDDTGSLLYYVAVSAVAVSYLVKIKKKDIIWGKSVNEK